MEKTFKASLIELAADEIIYLRHESRGFRLPNGAVDTISDGITSVSPTMTKNMIINKLTIMDKVKK